MKPWERTAIKNALNSAAAPPESLRFQCRIAMDAKENLAIIKLKGGETLTLHPKSRPQFGKNRDGLAYLTATMVYSGDGGNYTLRWAGDGVPLKMQQVAVKHDKGLAVKPVTIALDLAFVQILPSWQANQHSAPYVAGQSNASRVKAAARATAGAPKRVHATRRCARLTDADLTRTQLS